MVIERGICKCRLQFRYCVVIDVASSGSVELLKCLFNRGIDKDSTDHHGRSVMWRVVESGNVEAVRYLLDIGVAIPYYPPDILDTQGERCKNNRLIMENRLDRHRFKDGRYTLVVDLDEEYQDPCTEAIRDNNLEIIKLLDERGSQSCKSFFALRRAVIWGSVDVVSYLLNKYTYDLNIEYIIKKKMRVEVHILFLQNLGKCLQLRLQSYYLITGLILLNQCVKRQVLMPS